MSSHSDFEVLQGLPPYGPPAQPFSATGMGKHREGFVVRFMPSTAEEWVGNFQPGFNSFYQVAHHPNRQHLIVIAGGTAYVVDPSSRQLISEFGAQIESAHELPDLQSILFGNGLWFELHNSSGPSWRSDRVSWDGMKDILVTAEHVTGKGWCFDDTWHEFQVSLASGAVTGGAYNGQA